MTDDDLETGSDSTTFPTKAMLTRRVLPDQAVRYDGPEGAPVLVISVAADPPHWLKPAIERFGELLELRQNWDSYGALPIEPNHVVAAIELLALIMRDDTPVPAIVPTNRGHIQLEWHTPTADLEIETLSMNRFGVCFEDTAERERWDLEIVSDLNPVVKALSKFSGPAR